MNAEHALTAVAAALLTSFVHTKGPAIAYRARSAAVSLAWRVEDWIARRNPVWNEYADRTGRLAPVVYDADQPKAPKGERDGPFTEPLAAPPGQHAGFYDWAECPDCGFKRILDVFDECPVCDTSRLLRAKRPTLPGAF